MTEHVEGVSRTRRIERMAPTEWLFAGASGVDFL